MKRKLFFGDFGEFSDCRKAKEIASRQTGFLHRQEGRNIASLAINCQTWQP